MKSIAQMGRLGKLSRLDGRPTKRGTYSIEKLLEDLTADGQAFDAVYVFNAADAFTDLSGNGRTLAKTGTLNYLPGFGLQGNGVDGKLLGAGQPTDWTNFLQNHASLTILFTKQGNGRFSFGRDGASSQVMLDMVQTAPGPRLNSASGPSGMTTQNTLGAVTIWRDPADVGNLHLLHNLGTKQTRASVSAAKVAAAMAIFKVNVSFSSDAILAVLVGAGGTEAQIRLRHDRLIKLARSLGWVEPPVPSYSTLDPMSFVNHPDGAGSGVGVGIVCTGLCPDGLGGLWCGDDGRNGAGDTTFQAAVRHYADANNLASFVDFPLTAGALGAHFTGLGIVDLSRFSVQGVGVGGGKVWFIAKDTVSTNSRVVSMDPDGTNVASWSPSSFTSVPNGLVYYDGRVGVYGALLSFRAPADGTQLALANGIYSARTAGASSADQVWIDPTGSWMLFTGGANGSPGILEVWSISNQWNAPVHVKSITLEGCFAIEGSCVIDDVLYVNSDQAFHPAPNVEDRTNRLMKYDATGLLAF